MFKTSETYITPYLPKQATQEMKEWMKSGRAAFQRVVIVSSRADCKNCQDERVIYVSFCRAGPFKEVPGHGVGEALTWFDGGPGLGAGWYIIASMKTKKGNSVARTVAYPCPHCSPDQPMPEEEWQETLRADLKAIGTLGLGLLWALRNLQP